METRKQEKQKVLEFIKKNNEVPTRKIVDSLGITTSKVNTYLKELREEWKVNWELHEETRQRVFSFPPPSSPPNPSATKLEALPFKTLLSLHSQTGNLIETRELSVVENLGLDIKDWEATPESIRIRVVTNYEKSNSNI